MINILDTTIRDGGYAVDFKFSESQIFHIIKKLIDSGINYLELGHGVSIALKKELQQAKVNDLRVFELAKEIIKDDVKIGGILAAECCEFDKIKDIVPLLDFIRIGIRPLTTTNYLKYIEECKKHNSAIAVFIQLLQSHLYTGEMIEKVMQQMGDLNIEAIYIVDTLGCMSAEDIVKTYNIIQSITDLPVGFHGHNNSGQAISNALKAIDIGVKFVDATVGGLGRGAGNTQLEILLSLLMQAGKIKSHNLITLCELQNYLEEQFPHTIPGIKPIDFLSGHYRIAPWDMNTMPGMPFEIST